MDLRQLSGEAPWNPGFDAGEPASVPPEFGLPSEDLLSEDLLIEDLGRGGCADIALVLAGGAMPHLGAHI